jgi:ribosomal protein L31E
MQQDIGRLEQIATQMGIRTSPKQNAEVLKLWINEILKTERPGYERKKAICYVNCLRDQLFDLYRSIDTPQLLESTERRRSSFVVRRHANTIVSALAFRFDDGSDDDDYSKWTDEELFIVLKLSVKLSTSSYDDRCYRDLKEHIKSFVDRHPEIETFKFVYPSAARYIFDQANQGIPKKMRDNFFNELYPNVFCNDDGMFLLKMGNWDNKSLLIALILLGVEYDITTSNLDFTKIMNNTPLKILTEKKNPFIRTGIPPKLTLLIKNRLDYSSYKTETPLSIFRDRFFTYEVPNTSQSSYRDRSPHR